MKKKLYDLTDIDPDMVSLVPRGSIRLVKEDGTVDPSEPQRLTFWKAEHVRHYSIGNDGVCSTCGAEGVEVLKKDVDPNVGGGVDRDKLEDSDFVDPENRRFPVVKPGDVSDAASSFGRMGAPKIPFDTFKAKLTALAKRKGDAFVAQLPESWKEPVSKGANASKEDTMTLKDLRAQFAKLSKDEQAATPEALRTVLAKADGDGDDDGDGGASIQDHIDALKKATLEKGHKAQLMGMMKGEAEVATEGAFVGLSKAEVDSLPPAVRVALEKAEEDRKADRARIEKMESERAGERVKIRKAEIQHELITGASHVAGAPIEKIVDAVHTLEEASPELGKELVHVLKSSSELIRTGGVFHQHGTPRSEAGGSDPLAKLQGMAIELQKSEPALSFEQAYDKALSTEAGRALYAEASPTHK